MSKVFLAYKSVDVERATAVRSKLEQLGVSLFIDQKLISGDNYISEINEELSTALAVLVLWTQAAAHIPAPDEPPNFVLGEAQRGYSRGVLVAATFEKMALDHLPVPFNLVQAPDLSDWLPAAPARHREWQKVLLALGKKLSRPGLADLAIALDEGNDALKKKFLRDHPADPAARDIVAQLEVVERKDFDAQFIVAKKRIQQRIKEAERKLKACRDNFETQIGELQAGRDFMPPDPVEAIEDKISVLQTQIDIRNKTIDEERQRADRAEERTGKINAEVAELKSLLATSTDALGSKNAALEQLNADVAERDEQIATHQSTIAANIAQLTKIAEAGAAARQKANAAVRRRLFTWTAVAAAVAACVFFFVGKAVAPAESNTTTVVLDNNKMASLSAENRSLQSQIGDARRQIGDLTAQVQKLSSGQSAQQTDLAAKQAALAKQQADFSKQQDDLTAKQTALTKQQSDFAARQNALAKQQDDFTAKQAAFTKQQDDLTAKQAALARQQTDFTSQQTAKLAALASAQNDLTAKQAAFAQQQDAFKASQSAAAAVSLVAQCDALAGYQYDPDRPTANGYTGNIKDVAAAQRVCQSALQTAGIDQVTRRRLLLEIARTYVESAPPDFNTYVSYLGKASQIGSSQADYQLGMYYASRDNADLAWSYIQRSAAAHNPVALTRAAISQIFPDWNEHNITGRSLDSGFQYLQEALNLAYFRAYYVAGAAYWTYKDRDTPDRARATYYLTVSQCVTDKRDPNTDTDGAAYYYFKKTNKPLSCP
jgi:hypothetical protein